MNQTEEKIWNIINSVKSSPPSGIKEVQGCLVIKLHRELYRFDLANNSPVELFIACCRAVRHMKRIKSNSSLAIDDNMVARIRITTKRGNFVYIATLAYRDSNINLAFLLLVASKMKFVSKDDLDQFLQFHPTVAIHYEQLSRVKN